MRLAARDRAGLTSTIAIVAVALLALACIALALLLTRRPRAQPVISLPARPWATAAGEEFAALTEAERCDLVFALAAFDDEPSRAMLERALDDPSEGVCLAAARALAKLDRGDALERYFNAHPGERTRRISQALELFA